MRMNTSYLRILHYAQDLLFLHIQLLLKPLLQTQVLADAQIRATRRATLTVLNAGIGQPVAEGAHVATIADLDHFKVESQISDTQAERYAREGPS